MPGVKTTGVPSSSVAGVAFSGRVHGGQQAISGAHVYFYAVNTTGYAGPGEVASTSNASISLLASGANTTKDSNGNYYVTTDSNGAFSISADYTCQIAFPNTYLLSVGGNPGSGANSAANLMASVGNCTSSGFGSSYVVVNEVSTIAMAYAVSGYTTDPTHISTTGALLANAGVANAFLTLGNLYTQSSGTALATTPASNGVVPQAEIDTLANILAACVNSTGPSSTPCSTLFANAMNGATAPTDTATAAVNIAHNPGVNVATLFGLQTASSPFVPVLSAAPNDFTVALVYSGNAMSNPWGIAVDAAGNVWVANRGAMNISEFSPVGAVLSGTTGFTGGGVNAPIGIAIDGTSPGNAWTANYGNSSVSKFNSSGSPQSGSGFIGGGVSTPYAVAIDGNNNVWIGNTSTFLSEFNSSGTPANSFGFTGGGVDEPFSLAIDSSNNVWSANFGNASLSKLNSSGVAQSPSGGYTGGGLSNPESIAIDAFGDVWTANGGNASLSEFSSAGVAQSGSSGITGGGLSGPQGIAIDGSNNVWVADDAGGSLSEFNHSRTAITGTNGYKGGGLDNPYGIAIDGAGNVWVSNYSGGNVSEFVGLATPVVTPLAANLQIPYGSFTINRP